MNRVGRAAVSRESPYSDIEQKWSEPAQRHLPRYSFIWQPRTGTSAQLPNKNGTLDGTGPLGAPLDMR
jgi:hypothetical protein